MRNPLLSPNQRHRRIPSSPPAQRTSKPSTLTQTCYKRPLAIPFFAMVDLQMRPQSANPCRLHCSPELCWPNILIRHGCGQTGRPMAPHATDKAENPWELRPERAIRSVGQARNRRRNCPLDTCSPSQAKGELAQDKPRTDVHFRSGHVRGGTPEHTQSAVPVALV